MIPQFHNRFDILQMVLDHYCDDRPEKAIEIAKQFEEYISFEMKEEQTKAAEEVDTELDEYYREQVAATEAATAEKMKQVIRCKALDLCHLDKNDTHTIDTIIYNSNNPIFGFEVRQYTGNAEFKKTLPFEIVIEDDNYVSDDGRIRFSTWEETCHVLRELYLETVKESLKYLVKGDFEVELYS